MSIINAQMGGDVVTYQIDNSLIFNDDDSAYLSRTPSASNRDTWTYSTWVKRGNLGTAQGIFSAGSSLGTNHNNALTLVFAADNTLQLRNEVGGVADLSLVTTQLFRDVGAWYHIVLAVDSTQGTAADRVNIYVNGTEVTDFSTSTYMNQNVDTWVNSANAHWMGQNQSAGYLDGYLAETYFIDGQQLTPSDFGQTDPITNQWIPKAYAGTYGTNGFYLDFEDETSTTTLGYDVSGNANHWTLTNMATTDQTTDSPTDNFCTFNTLELNGGCTFQEGNTEVSIVSDGASGNGCMSSFGPSSGKWYWEVTMVSGGASGSTGIGNASADLDLYTGGDTNSWGYFADGSKYTGGSGVAYGDTYTDSDVIGIALDLDNGKIWWSKNGTFQASGDPAAGTNEAYSGLSGTLFPFTTNGSSSGTDVQTVEYGSKGFTYTPPTGFVALSTANLPIPTIKDPTKYFNPVKYVGDGSADQGITGVNFQPNLTWIKNRDTTDSHKLVDSVRGATNELSSNSTAVEAANADGLLTFDTDGFSVGADLEYNTNTENYISWNWLESATAGFDIVTYTGTGTAHAESHSLGVTPDLIIVKERTDDVGNWFVFHSANTAAPETDYLILNATSATQDIDTIWNDVAPTSTQFTVGTHDDVNGSGDTYIAYLFAGVEGYSKFDSFEGNGAADGTFVYCGFRPALVICKSIDSTSSWHIYDNLREGYNVDNDRLAADGATAEGTADEIDLLSNGFKLRIATDPNVAETYVYMAWAESPFPYSNAR